MPRNDLVISELSVDTIDGIPLLTDVSVNFARGLHGVVGHNGAGKSTLMRVIADRGALASGGAHISGSVQCSGSIGYVSQNLALSGDATVADTLGITPTLQALERIEMGAGSVEDFDAVEGQWDIRERSARILASLDVEVELQRPTRTLSGGEVMAVAITGQLVTNPDVLVLDEPTNNLDQKARKRLIDVLQHFSGVAIVVSHDLELLNVVDRIVEIDRGRARTFGGNYDNYHAQIEAERVALEADIATARGEVQRQRADLAHMNAVVGSRRRMGKKAELEKRVPRVVAHLRRDSAQKSSGQTIGRQEQSVAEAQSALQEARDKVRRTDTIRIVIPPTHLSPGRMVVRCTTPWQGSALHSDEVGCEVFRIDGPERIALTGPNGAGKTTLVNRISSGDENEVFVPIAMVPQRLDHLRNHDTAEEAIMRANEHLAPHEAKAALANFLFKGTDSAKLVGDLSGGERLRLALACALRSRPAPQLLILDEPTNNLDITSVEHLIDALNSFDGALLVVSHDKRFLERLQITRTVELRTPDS